MYVCRVLYLTADRGLIGINAMSSHTDDAATLIEQGRLPAVYRDWKLISVAREEGKIDDIRAILGNDIAIDAFKKGTRPFPDGAIITRLAWELTSSQQNNEAFGGDQSFVAGVPKNGIQFMVKDASRYASTGGWRYYQFDNGELSSNVQKTQACVDCHNLIAQYDHVFTLYAP